MTKYFDDLDNFLKVNDMSFEEVAQLVNIWLNERKALQEQLLDVRRDLEMKILIKDCDIQDLYRFYKAKK